MNRNELAKNIGKTLKELQNQITEAALEVEKNIGPGFSPPDYCRALACEFALREIPYQSNIEVDLPYKGNVAGKYRLDFVIDEKVILSVMASDGISESEQSRQRSFLRALGLSLGIVVNFADERVEIKAVHANHTVKL